MCWGKLRSKDSPEQVARQASTEFVMLLLLLIRNRSLYPDMCFEDKQDRLHCSIPKSTSPR